jgi:hypothetical protein
MSKRPALRKLILVAALSVAAFGIMPIYETRSGDFGNGANTPPPSVSRPTPGHVGPSIGGYSWTLSDVWGPAEMPPAPKDFGPHFDWQPEPLSGGLSHDPYPN